MKYSTQVKLERIGAFFSSYAAEIAISVCLIAIIIIIYFYLISKKRKLVMESSVYYHEVKDLNSRYNFHEDIFDAGVYDFTYEFTTKQKYDRYSLEDVMDILLQDKLLEFERAIQSVDDNKRAFQNYCMELDGFHSEMTEEECRLY